jgi:tungstate transport system ATP-binding protein
VRLGSPTVLDIPQLAIERGRITAVVGPNGAGKTTLLRLLAFLVPPAEGSITFEGQTVRYNGRELMEMRRRVTLVSQSPLLFHRTVRANVAFGLRVRGRESRERVAEALSAVGMADFANRPAWKLSGGEAQRVALARALAIEPDVYLFDEPTANVDREHVGVIESQIKRLGAVHATVVLTTHNLEQAYRLADVTVSLAHGRLAPAPLINVLRGTASQTDVGNYFLTNDLCIEVANGCKPTAIAIDPEDIIVSRHPLDSSARNCFPGRVLKVEEDKGSIILTVDCGPILLARITRHSYEEMALNVGARVHLTFKSSAIHILAQG